MTEVAVVVSAVEVEVEHSVAVELIEVKVVLPAVAVELIAVVVSAAEIEVVEHSVAQ